MCGRFNLHTPIHQWAQLFLPELDPEDAPLDDPPRYNIAPTQFIAAIREDEDKRRELVMLRWGLVPFWAKDIKIGSRSINARSETAATKPMFRSSFEKRRCLIPVDGFYEWERKAKGKLPHYIYAADNKPLPVAGLWSSWNDPETDERVLTCTILTTSPNDLLSSIHDRMPVVLPRDQWASWLNPDNNDTDALQQLMVPYPAALMAEHPVSTLVNKVANNVPELITPLETGAVDP